MFKHFEKWARDDSNVKMVFDHLRNIGLVALVFGVAAWKQKHIDPGWVAVWDYLAMVILWCTGWGLMWFNHENLFSKLRGSDAPLWIKLFFAVLYGVIFGELVKYLLAGRA